MLASSFPLRAPALASYNELLTPSSARGPDPLLSSRVVALRFLVWSRENTFRATVIFGSSASSSTSYASHALGHDRTRCRATTQGDRANSDSPVEPCPRAATPGYLDYENYGCLACPAGLVRSNLGWTWAGCTHNSLSSRRRRFSATHGNSCQCSRDGRWDVILAISLLQRPRCAATEGDAPRGYC